LYVGGHGYKYIVEELREKGYKSKYGGDIGANAIKTLLENERYIGVYTWNKKRTKYYGEWAGGADNPNCVRREYMLSGLIRCEKCGAAFHGVTRTSGKGYKTPYYVCTAKHNKKSCDAQNINANELETLVVTILKHELLNPEFIERTATGLLKRLRPPPATKTKKPTP